MNYTLLAFTRFPVASKPSLIWFIRRISKRTDAKNKVAPPFRMVEFDIMFGEGISKVGEIVDIGVDLEIVQKSGSWYSYNGTKLGQGRDAVKQLLLDNPEMADEIEAKIREKVKPTVAAPAPSA